MDTLKTILNGRIIAISRGIYGAKLIDSALALYEGGVRAFEVTFEQDKDLGQTSEAVGRLYESLPTDAAVGAGTVLTPDQVRMAKNAGASFIISPDTRAEVVAETKRLGLISIPGAMTPTEVVRAYSLGADIVKVFPAGVLGAEYFKALKAPLAHIPLAAVAGITPENILKFHKAGAAAFGISTGLYKPSAVENGDTETLKSLAKLFLDSLSEV